MSFDVHRYIETLSAGQPVSDTSNPMESLPLELRLEILLQAPDLQCLKALVRASSAYHEAYLAFRARVLFTVTCRELPEDDLRHALAAVWSSTRLRTQHDDSREEVIAFLDRYRRPKETRCICVKGVTIEESIGLIHLHKMTDRIITELIKHMEHTVNQLRRAKVILTGSEKRRFYRAIYRWQTYSNVFPSHGSENGDFSHDVDNSPTFDTQERRTLFFADITPWECEEFYTIIGLADSIYRDLQYHEYMTISIAGLLEDDFDPADRSAMHHIYWLVTQGPQTFHRVITAEKSHYCHSEDI